MAFSFGLNQNPHSDRVFTSKVVHEEKMGIGNLNLTTSLKPKTPLLKKIGLAKHDNFKKRIYKNFCKLDFAEVFWEPHKFDLFTNLGIPYTKIDIHPKHFDRFDSLIDYLFDLFPNQIDLQFNQFNISRIEVHSDIGNLPLDVVLARLWVMGYRRESVSFYKGNTIYIGSNPKIRVFNKTNQLMRKVANRKELAKWEQDTLKKNESITRFSIEIRNFGMNLQDIADNLKQLVSYFDRFKFYNFEDEGTIPQLGGLQILLSKIRREHRKALQEFRDKDLEKLIRENFISSINQWFKKKKKEKNTFNLDKEIDHQINKLITAFKS